MREMYIFSIYRTGEDGIVKYDGKNILFLIFFFLIEKLGISLRFMILCFFFRQIHKKIRFPGLLRFLLQISHNMTTIRVKKKLIKMGGWDGEVEIKELKKNISSAYILFRLDTKTLIMRDTMRPKLFMKLHLNFPAIILRDFSRAYFIIMNEKAFDRQKIS